MRTRRTVAAIAVAAAVTTSGLLTACDAAKSGSADATPVPAASTSGSGNGTGGTPTSGATTAAPAALNGTGGSLLTISNGTSQVLMNGTSVDFGVVVRDLAWSPDGKKAVFIDGAGNLDTANPDGSGRVTVAHNPGGQTWSHPTWQTPADNATYRADNVAKLFFVATTGGTTRLMTVHAGQANGTPTPLPLNHQSGAGVADLPQTGNIWISGGGGQGTTTYANTGNGEVYLRDDYIRQQGEAVTNGSEPALVVGANSVAGGVVFVRSVGGHDHVFVDDLKGKSPTITDLTPQATTDYTEPAVSPDGRTVAMRTPNGIALVPIDGSAAPRLVSTTPGLPAYR